MLFLIPGIFGAFLTMDDPIYSFNEIMNHIDLKSYAAEKGCGVGRPKRI